MDEDWDSGSEQVRQLPAQNRAFGSRGRGFRPYEKGIGLKNGKNGSFLNEENGSNFSDSVDAFRGEYEDVKDCNDYKSDYAGDKEFSRNERGKKTGKNFQKPTSEKGDKPKGQRYIPQEILDIEEELFQGGISCGINFNKYDDIEVKVSGENIPKRIESFGEAGLRPILLANITKCSYRKPTPIQKYALPIVMSGRDMMACAQTGSGKTAAFLIPIVNCLLDGSHSPVEDENLAAPQVVIVTPTRELAIQIYIEARKFTFGSKLKTEICYGGTAVFPQKQRVKRGCDILIATPGRLKDFLRNVVTFRNVRFFVCDEADRMLDLSFLPDIEKFFYEASTNGSGNVQTLMFSATFPEEIQRLATKFLKDYLFLAVGIVGGACADVEQKFHLITKYDKRSKLVELLKEVGSGKTLVFVEKKRTADIIATFLSEKDFPTTSMHGDREQVLREEALNDFKSGKMDVLVATAVAARGLDIKNVAHVINFDLPRSIDEYVHRIGRTGRVGNRGLATSFFDPEFDSALAPSLVKILTQAQQEVPSFLEEACQGNISVSGGSSRGSNFGGRDIRNRRSRESGNDFVLEATNTYEDEVW